MSIKTKYMSNLNLIICIILLIILLIIIIVTYILYYYREYNETIYTASNRTLEKDGIVILYKANYNQMDEVPNIELINDVMTYLPEDYIFLDYMYKIDNSAIFTFHRDITSSQKIFNTKYPVYTLIVYKANGCLLSYCPGSHKSYPFVSSHIVNLKGKEGTAVLFDCEILHAGCINDCKPRTIIQYKLCHKDDIDLLHSLQGVYKEKKEICNNSVTNKCLRKLSYYFEFPINYYFSPFMMKKYDPHTFSGYLQSLIPYTYYYNV